MKKKKPETFPTLESVTKPYLTTDELAHYTNLRPQTWRMKACYDSAPEGLRPLRICGRLAWSTEAVKLWLGVAA